MRAYDNETPLLTTVVISMMDARWWPKGDRMFEGLEDGNSRAIIIDCEALCLSICLPVVDEMQCRKFSISCGHRTCKYPIYKLTIDTVFFYTNPITLALQLLSTEKGHKFTLVVVSDGPRYAKRFVMS